MIRRFVALVAASLLAGCTVGQQGVSPFAGPSELGLSLTVSATPDLLSQDGKSQTQIAIVARDAMSQPASGIAMRLDMIVDGAVTDYGTLSSRSISTNAEGRATVVYTAPAPPPPTVTSDTTVNIRVQPVGTNFDNTTPRFVALRLMRPGVIQPPADGLTASFSIQPTSPKVGDTIVFDASASTAAPRSITSYQWSFGDGSSGNGKIAAHAYSGAGTFGVTLTVTDDLGRTASLSKTISLGANLPKAEFVFSPANPLVSDNVVFNGQPSTPGVGRTIVSYSWDFGDGSTGGGATAQHSYDVVRIYTVVLTVTDDLGQVNVQSHPVDVKDLSASFTISPSDPVVGANVFFNASPSRVAGGGVIVSYDWDFGDGQPHGSGATPQTTYSRTGTFTVVLTITDNRGKIGTATKTVTVK